MSTEASDEHLLLTQLDWQSHEILRGIYEQGGTATTSEIKKRTRITDTDPITYRFRRAAVALEPHGLIEVHEPDLTASQRSLPLEATLTERGEALAERVIERDGGPRDLDERLEKIEATLSTLEEKITNQSSVSEPASESHSITSEERLQAVEQRVDRLDDDAFGGWSEKRQQQYQVMLTGERAIRDFLLDKHGESFKHYVDERLDNNE
ncbi:hypothetical protein ACFQJ8_27095 [Halocatena marina]|uniref:hypothetical protein n=1 Tax=Halocatena marina TaxID=2934937 RepID=UPI003607F05B